jgi:hypothetical protein
LQKRDILEKEKDKGKDKPDFKRKKLILIIPVIIIICIIGLVWFTQASDVVKAQLIIDYGTVEIKHEGGSWIPAESGTLLLESDYVKTGSNTYASIVLFESSIIRLDSNTEVVLQEIIEEAGKTSITLQQETGRTWNTIQKISGIDNYDVQTPTTVASVRGTTFDVNVTTNGTTDVIVINGTVIVSSTKNGTVVNTIEVNGNESVTIESEKINESLETTSFEKDEWIRKNLNEDEELRKEIKEELYERIDQYIPQIKEEFGITDEELDVLIDGYIDGHYDLPPETPDWIRELIEYS